jgi:hypothetical protein
MGKKGEKREYRESRSMKIFGQKNCQNFTEEATQ